MWCEKCHYGGDNITFKLDSGGNFQCLQCGFLGTPLYKSPFNSNKHRTPGGKSLGNKQISKKFVFDQKGGTNTDSAYTSGSVPIYKSTKKSYDLLDTKEAIDKMIKDNMKQSTYIVANNE
jgi:hypothetical protein